LAVGTRSGSICRWDLTRPEAGPSSWKAHTAAVSWLLFDPSSTALFSLGADRHVRRWRVGDGSRTAQDRYGDLESSVMAHNGRDTLTMGGNQLRSLDAD